MENHYAPICRREAHSNSRYRNTVWNISRWPFYHHCYFAVKQVEHKIWRICAIHILCPTYCAWTIWGWWVKNEIRSQKSYKQLKLQWHPYGIGTWQVWKDCTQERKIVLSQNLILNIKREVQQLEQGKTFWYLGSEESEGILHQQVMIKIEEGIHQEIRMIIKAELNAKSKITEV